MPCVKQRAEEVEQTFLAKQGGLWWQLDPTRDGYAFKEAIVKVSRASRSASKGAGASQSVVNDGFRQESVRADASPGDSSVRYRLTAKVTEYLGGTPRAPQGLPPQTFTLAFHPRS